MNGPGFLIAIEGIDGTGKTTQAKRLAVHLESRGLPVLLTREPTDGPFGRKIRELSAPGKGPISPEEELQLFLSDRREHVDHCILPALRDGKLIITDRYYFSTIAYQGARGVPVEEIRGANEAFAPPPDMLILISLDPAISMERIKKVRGSEPDWFEDVKYLQRVAEIFDDLDDPFVHRFDGSGNIDDLAEELARETDRAVSQWQRGKGSD